MFLSSIHFKPLGHLAIVLPLAISFIVFEKITYVVDVYWGKGKPASITSEAGLINSASLGLMFLFQLIKTI